MQFFRGLINCLHPALAYIKVKIITTVISANPIVSLEDRLLPRWKRYSGSQNKFFESGGYYKYDGWACLPNIIFINKDTEVQFAGAGRAVSICGVGLNDASAVDSFVCGNNVADAETR